MRPVAAVLGLVFCASPAQGFLAQPRSQHIQSHHTAHAASPAASLRHPAGQKQEQESSTAFSSGAALFIALLLAKGAKSAVGMRAGVKTERLVLPAAPGCFTDYDNSRGPEYRSWVELTRIARKGYFYGGNRPSMRKGLRREGISAYNRHYKVWYPGDHDRWETYWGPESHPDNPDFPAASSGPWFQKAVNGWAPAQLSSSVGRQGKSGGLLVAGKAPTFGSKKRMVRGSRSAIAMNAHKMAASCSKNHGSGSKNPGYWNISQKNAVQGAAVKAGTLLVRQRGYEQAYPGGGTNTSRYKIYARVDGIVQWRGSNGRAEISVVPWEYVKTKCEWIPGKVTHNTLTAKEYAPWMGTHMHSPKPYCKGGYSPRMTWGAKRRDIAEKRATWLDTEEGEEWLQKKEEQKKVNKEYAKRNYSWLKRKKLKRTKAKGIEMRTQDQGAKKAPPVDQ